MELRQLITFIRIVQMESFSRAAASLGYSQSAVTVQIRLLEEELNTRLFDRMGKRCRLTAKGERFHAYANNIINEVNQARLALEEGEALKGTLHLGTIESICYSKLPAILHDFHTHHPGVSIRITTASPEELIKMMEQGELDLIDILDEPRNSDHWSKRLEKREEIVFVTGSKNELLEKDAYRLSELIREPFYLTEQNANYRRALDRYLEERQLTLTPFLEASSIELIIRFLEESRGVSLLPYYAVREEIAAGRLSLLPVEDFHAVMYRQIFLHRDKWVTREMEAYVRTAEHLA